MHRHRHRRERGSERGWCTQVQATGVITAASGVRQSRGPRDSQERLCVRARPPRPPAKAPTERPISIQQLLFRVHPPALEQAWERPASTLARSAAVPAVQCGPWRQGTSKRLDCVSKTFGSPEVLSKPSPAEAHLAHTHISSRTAHSRVTINCSVAVLTPHERQLHTYNRCAAARESRSPRPQRNAARRARGPVLPHKGHPAPKTPRTLRPAGAAVPPPPTKRTKTAAAATSAAPRAWPAAAPRPQAFTGLSGRPLHLGCTVACGSSTAGELTYVCSSARLPRTSCCPSGSGARSPLLALLWMWLME